MLLFFCLSCFAGMFKFSAVSFSGGLILWQRGAFRESRNICKGGLSGRAGKLFNQDILEKKKISK
ncbi:hypothetical protein EO98_05595 [Methanosarcina sp. 2.H.T.1A.6]|nr:hypothetical protein EO98_05595 [Methanosarcina sp. 2.H.T.1A.6]KKG26017.1 hypothetical protein EO96_16005 [Methanosarcina sp. 2.H.T.1A.8]KKG27828.1 hypothetical protein EO97_02175 [Methanosarcina sp. 2.H.T.1A.15]